MQASEVRITGSFHAGVDAAGLRMRSSDATTSVQARTMATQFSAIATQTAWIDTISSTHLASNWNWSGVRVPPSNSGQTHLRDVRSEYTRDMATPQVYMKKQVELFMQRLPLLLQQYKGLYVAFEDGKVLASGEKIGPLIKAVDASRGYKAPVLIRQVQAEYLPIEL